MITIIGLKYYSLSYFHLIYHAYFKALLFLTAGSIIHTIMDIQDFRFTGGLINFLPVSALIAIIGFTSLTGLPFTTGFYSKEMIINQSFYYEVGSVSNLFLNYIPEFIYLITILAAFLTILYSLKYILILFFNTTKLSLFQFSNNLHYYSLYLTFSLTFLALLATFIGYLLEGWNLLLNFNTSFINIFVPAYIRFIPIIFFIISYWTPNIIIALWNKLGDIFGINNNLSVERSILFNNIEKFSISSIKNYYGFKLLYTYIAGFFINLSYRVFFKILDSGYIDLFISILSLNIYNIPHYFNNGSLSPSASDYNIKFSSISQKGALLLSIILFSIFILINII